MLVVAGVTGVGKSTALEGLGRRLRCILLPDRRQLADRIVFPLVQDEVGEPRRPVRDRVERFRLTALYRERHRGGMAHALSRLRVDPAAEGLLVFDGLRGAEEIGWAIEHLSRARFLALHAPEAVRLFRLLDRGEAFDRAELPVGAAPPRAGSSVASRGDAWGAAATLAASVPGLDAVVGRDEIERLLRSPALDGVSLDEVARKAAILVEEARNYDPRAAVRLLEESLDARRRLVIDTSALGRDEVVDRVVEWLERPS